MAMQNISFHRGTILNPISDKRCDFHPESYLVIKGTKAKSKVVEILAEDKARKKYGKIMTQKNSFDHGHSLIMPGLYDMHFHWVQDDVRQMPKDSLLQWLEKYTFPTEMKYANRSYAKKKAKSFFKKLSSVGTVGGACYSSIHEHAVEAAMEEVKGDFLIGNVLMNMNSPKKLSQKEDDALALTSRLIKKFKKRYIFTPRFAISTSPRVMKEGSALADKAGCFKQSHLSETPNEIEFVLSLYRAMPGFEDIKSYTDIYHRTGMLGKKSLMGHGIHLGTDELKLLRKTSTSLIHCPTSNAPLEEQGLGSGLFDFKKIEAAKIRWALGSDIGGGPFLSMFDVMRSFVEQNEKKGVTEATYIKALYRSSLAGADILGIGDKSGNLAKGKEANFLVVPLNKKMQPSDAEQALKMLISFHRNKRKSYETIVSYVCLRGEAIHTS